MENASGFLNPLETAVLEIYLLWVLRPSKCYPSMTQILGTKSSLSGNFFPKLVRVREAGSPERRKEQIYFSPTHLMSTWIIMEPRGGESLWLDPLRNAALDGHPEGALGCGKMYCSTKYFHSKTQKDQQKHWGPRTVRDEPPL